MAAVKKIANDATASVSGTIYQICVALERAFLLEEGQKLWIEKFGDVTVSGQIQIETKRYSDSLTDNHSNFWNTLKNWLHPDFNQREYKSLVLFTTQPFGNTSKLRQWNESDVSKRIEILVSILNASELRFGNRKSSKKSPNKPPEILIDQRFVLDKSRLGNLKEIIPKIYIACDSPGVAELCKTILDVHAKTILRAKRNDFLDGLLGYLLNPSTVEKGWEISYDGFSEKLTLLSNQYRRGTVFFPSKYRIPTANMPTEQIELHKEMRFVQKLTEIEYQEVIPEAIQHYISANLTVFEEFQNYEVDPMSYQVYANNIKQSQRAKHRVAKKRLIGNRVIESQNFYDDVTGESPQSFPRFEQTPIEFRNGVYHMLADDESDEFQWKLWE